MTGDYKDTCQGESIDYHIAIIQRQI